MICEAATVHNNGFANNGLGCNISVTLSDGSFEDTQITRGDTSPKKASFFDNLMRRSPSVNKKEKNSAQSSWTTTKPIEEVNQSNEKDEEMAKFIEQLELEGKSEAEIALHLSHIIDTPAPSSPKPTPAPAPAKSKSIVSQFFSEVQQVIRDIGFDDDEEYIIYPPEDLRGLTISISSAPFFGALPPDTDMTFEELASMEPVYNGSRCVNNLPACTHDGSPLPGDQTTCSVCLCDFNEGETLKSLPACVHFFHQDCIDTWLMVGHTCPLCKTLVQ